MTRTLLILLVLVIQAAQSAVTLTTSANPVTLGQPLTLTAAVTPTDATGTVTFYDGATILGIQQLSAGKASLTTGLLPTGTRFLRAFYKGVNATLTQTVRSVPANGFQFPITSPSQIFAANLAMGDFNHDGKPDFAIADGTLSVRLGNGDGTFQPAVTYPAGAIPRAVAVADFNGDGVEDLAVANSGANFGGNVSILLGNGDGTFQPPISYLATSTAFFIAVADFNADGIADLVVASTGTGSGANFNILLGNGDGTFQDPVISIRPCRMSTCPSAQTAVGDFNGDGKADLAVADGYSLSVLLGNGDGTFQPDDDYGSSAAPANVISADLNADGITDLAFLSSNSGLLYVLLGKGDGTFSTPESYPYNVNGPFQAKFFTTADFDGDGKLDLLVGAQGIGVLRGNGDGTFQPLVNYFSYNLLNAIPGALGGDGRVGLAGIGLGLTVALGTEAVPSTLTLTSSPDPSIYAQDLLLTATISPSAATGRILFSDGAITLGTQPLTAGTAVLKTNALLAGSHTLTATYSGDSTYAINTTSTLTQTVNPSPETITLSSSANPSTYGAKLTLTATITLPGGLPTTGAVTFRDGATTLGTANLVNAAVSLSATLLPVGTHTLIATYSGDANHAAATSSELTQVVTQGGVTTPPISLTSSPNPSLSGQSVSLGATLNPRTAIGTVSFYDGVVPIGSSVLSSGSASFTTNLLSSGNHFLRAIYGGSAGFTTGTSPGVSQTVTTLPSTGFKTVSTPLPGINPQASATADFNQDGTPDLVIADKASGSILVLSGNSDGTFQPATKLATGGSPNAVAVADFNGDGHTDIAATNGVDVSILLGNGDGTFAPAVHFASGAFQSLAVADFNNDGHPDIALLQPAAVTILLNQGDSAFQAQQTYPVTNGVTAIAAADLNNDGTPDLMVVSVITPFTTPRSDSTTYLTTLLGNGDGTFQLLQPSMTGGNTYTIVIADFNGDGIPDLALGSQAGTKVEFGEVITLFGIGDGTFRPGAGILVPGLAVPFLISGDFNADGVTDLATGSFNGGAFLLPGKSDGSFVLGNQYFSASSGPLAIADWNRDGRPDIAAVRADGIDVLLATATPNPTATAIVEAAGYQASLASGGIAALFGTFPIAAPTQASTAPLPTSLGGVSVQFADGRMAPLFAVSNSQINLQIPPIAGYTTLTVSVNGQNSQPLSLTTSASGTPAIFTTNSQGTGQGAILDSSNHLVDPTNPTTTGATIQIYCQGLGPVDNPPASGAPSPANPPSKAQYTPFVNIGGVPATVVFSGLTPGAVGLYQINAIVPAASSKGNAVPVIIGGGNRIATIAVQ